MKDKDTNGIVAKPRCTTEANDMEVYDEYNTSKVILGDYSHAPEYLKDNEFIRKGYRLNCNTVPKVVKSLFVCNNESVNIWTHLIGAFLAMCFIIYCVVFVSFDKEVLMSLIDYQSMMKEILAITNPFIKEINTYKEIKDNNNNIIINNTIDCISNTTNDFILTLNEQGNTVQKFDNYFDDISTIITNVNENSTLIQLIVNSFKEMKNKLIDILNQNIFNLLNDSSSIHGNKLRKWPLYIMLSSAIVCLSFSALFHWIGALSPHIFQILSRLDYAGITILIAGSCYPPYFYFFYCETFLATVYLCFISIFAITVFLFTLSPDFHIPKRRTLRGTLFLSLGISTAIPIFHLIFFGKYVSGFEKSPHLIYWELGGISYISGALMYIRRIPEKFFPGKFDLFGASHQIFQCLVVAGVVLHYLGSLDSYYYRAENACPRFV